jgi:hypothetical protein
MKIDKELSEIVKNDNKFRKIMREEMAFSWTLNLRNNSSITHLYYPNKFEDEFIKCDIINSEFELQEIN